MSTTYKARIKEFDDAIQEENLDILQIRKLCFAGVPEGQGRRAMAWRILLNYLPESRKSWPDYLNKQRTLYNQFLEEIIIQPLEKAANEDHPLNPNPNSQWQSFFKDNEVLLQVDKDVRRLYPEISFFSQPTEHPNERVVFGGHERLHQRVHQTVLNSQSLERKGMGVQKFTIPNKKKCMEDYAPLDEGREAHWEVVERILFLYAKLNPGQSYVQGMNEIVGPIYYVFATDSRKEWREYAESDCFFCFTNIMSDIRDFFIKSLDEAESGINAMMGKLMSKLGSLDPDVKDVLDNQGIRPQYFSFRWLTLMLSQEFPLPEVLRIWDSLLADESRSKFLIDVCAAMILLIRQDLLTNEFPENMKLLQNYPTSMDVHVILSKAAGLSSNIISMVESSKQFVEPSKLFK